MDPKLFQDYTRRIVDNCSRVIVGKEEVIRQVVVSFLCGGHVMTGVSMKSGGIIWQPATS